MSAEPLSILVVGGTGATGRRLVEALLERGHRVRIIARSPERLPASVRDHANASIVVGRVLDMEEGVLVGHVRGCDAIASCLGHTLSLRGVFGPPWRLVAGSAARLCRAVRASDPAHPVRFVLMGSTGCRNRDVVERVSLAQRVVVGAIRALVPPHADNEAAAEFFRTRIGRDDPCLAWVVVRPDSLIDEPAPTAYRVVPSPTRSAIFDPGRTSRVNVAHFMAELVTEPDTWSRWVGQMPVIYNEEAGSARGSA